MGIGSRENDGIDVRRKVIVNADDFGFSDAINAGIIEAHVAGVVTSTSLMMGGDAMPDAVALARHHLGLSIGLHVSFADVKPILSPESVYLLVRGDGKFPPDESALNRALRSNVGRRQVKAEIAAQFDAFHATGLACDHVNSHRHVHHHPLVALMIFREAARYKITATRLPWDPPAKIDIVNILRYVRQKALRMLAAMFKLKAPNRSIGRVWDATMLAKTLVTLPKGTSEIYCHPSQHGFPNDLQSLLDKDVKAALKGLTMCSYRSAIIGAI